MLISSILSISFFWTVLLRIPELWVVQPWKHELWGVSGSKPLHLSLPPSIVTVSRDLWTLTRQVSFFHGNRWWFTVQVLPCIFISFWGERLNKSLNLYICTLYKIYKFTPWINGCREGYMIYSNRLCTCLIHFIINKQHLTRVLKCH